MSKQAISAIEGRWTSFTYADVNDPWWKKRLIEAVEFSTGRAKIERLYNEIRDLEVHPKTLWSLGLQQLQVEMVYDAAQLQKDELIIVFIGNIEIGIY